MWCCFPQRSGWSYCKVAKNWLQCVRIVAIQPMSFYRNSFCSRHQLMTWICLPVTSNHTPCVTHTLTVSWKLFTTSKSDILTNYFNENKRQSRFHKISNVIKCIIYIYTYIHTHTHTLTDHFNRYTLLVPDWTHFCLQNCLNSLWHRLNKVLETFLRDFGPYWHDSITQLLQICRLHIHDANLPFHHIPKVLYWIEIWWLWRPFE